MNTLTKAGSTVILSVGLFLTSVGLTSATAAEPVAPSYAVQQRTNVTLSAVEHAHLLTEMNEFMKAIHEITSALAVKDFATVIKVATAMGPKGGHQDVVGKALHDRLPKDWFELARPTHQKFLAIATEAKNNPSVEAVLGRVGATTQQCVACHATYRLSVAP